MCGIKVGEIERVEEMTNSPSVEVYDGFERMLSIWAIIF